MGLLSRIGRNFADQFGKAGAMARGIPEDMLDRSWRPVEPWGMGHYAASPAVYGAMGAAGGGLMGAATNPNDPASGALAGAGTGAALLGGATGAMAGSVMLKRLAVAVARALKQQAPHISDEAAMAEASKIVQQPDAWAKLKAMGISDPRDGLSGQDRNFFNKNYRGDQY